ncbi:MAG TPA: hypothetical protein VHB50_14580, partial [Bryobacteraceae bacterium]|nr:hypothetical protein [Bryobacteraceae bacterium]
MRAQLRRILLIFTAAALQAHAQLPCEEKVAAKIHLDEGHPWRPPFGLGRVGRPVTAVVEISAASRPLREYYLTAFQDGHETARHVLNLGQSGGLFTDTTSFPSHPDELVLSAKCRYQGQDNELLREPVRLPDFEADAIARPDKLVNPVDLGTILIPADWLLIAAGQKAVIDVAAISWRRDFSGAHVKAWFESSGKATESGLALER